MRRPFPHLFSLIVVLTRMLMWLGSTALPRHTPRTSTQDREAGIVFQLLLPFLCLSFSHLFLHHPAFEAPDLAG